MARDPNHPDNSDPSDQKFLSQIESYGWNVTNVFRREGQTGPDWSYSTGLFHAFQHPEIVIFGLELDNMQKIVNNIGLKIKDGASLSPAMSIKTSSLDAAASSVPSMPVAMRIT